MVTAINLLVFALLGAGAMGGFLVLQRRRRLAAAAVMVATTAVTVMAARLILDATIDSSYHKDEALRRMHTPHEMSFAIIHWNRTSVQREETRKVLQHSRISSSAAPCASAMTRQTCRSASSTSTANWSASTSSCPRVWRSHSASGPSSSPLNGCNCPTCSPTASST